eukprot:1472237-Rhodomonas_salina.1
MQLIFAVRTGQWCFSTHIWVSRLTFALTFASRNCIQDTPTVSVSVSQALGESCSMPVTVHWQERESTDDSGQIATRTSHLGHSRYDG